ncbi:hypothetical protein [Telmatospirillum sp.]|uniref:hypothetical protein n=1 Tax=Telmatospirillum sp. TaxID=2079197 RepID=UPI002843B3F5|nr:hypothetical protein [Telmatospirillum sp.]MDR3438537.1 hypothetical protein [Telmatospirillum sp.]
MDRRHDETPPPSANDSEDPAVSEFVGVMGRLRSVIAEENDLLNRGLPATMLDTIELKAKLSKEFGSKGGDLVNGSSGQDLNGSALQEQLLNATAQLYAMTEENRQLLSNALSATRRRVDKVMEAIRALDDTPTNDGETSPDVRLGR